MNSLNDLIPFILGLGGTILIYILTIIIRFKYKQSYEYESDTVEPNYFDHTINKTSNLKNEYDEVLNVYDQSAIKIPLEIIEELNYMNLVEREEVFRYIENQRHHWKLENSKKVYRSK